MKRSKPYIYKRVIAFVIDLLVITLLSGILTLILTDSTKYDNDTKELVEVTQKLTNNDITTEEYQEVFNEINYNLTKDSIGVTSITVIVTIIYYVFMTYYCHGITLGKYLMKLRIVSANENSLNMLNLFLRCLIINGVLSNIVTLILINVLTKEQFNKFYSPVSNAVTVLMFVSIILMMYRADGRGLHDLIGNTRVIDVKEVKEEIKEVKKEEKEEIKEVKVIKEVPKKNKKVKK